MEMEGSKDFKDYRNRTKTRFYILGTLLAIFLIVSVTFIVLYVLKVKDSDDDDSKSTKPSKNGNADELDGRKICQTHSCIRTANIILENMDTTAKPCDDFMAYACGKFYKTAKIDSDKTSKGHFGDAGVKSTRLFQELLESPLQRKSKSSFEYKMKTYYKACLDEDAMEKHGLVDYTVNMRNEWPTLNRAWQASSFDLQDLVDRYATNSLPVLFIFYLRPDNRGNIRTNMIEMDHPGFLLGRQILIGDRNSPYIKAYETLYKEFAVALGANNLVAERDASSVIDLYSELAKISLDQTRSTNTALTYNPTTLGNMNADYPYLNWVTLFQSVLSASKVNIDSTQKINIKDTNYMTQLGPILNNPNNRRALQNAFGFAQATNIVGGATKQMRQLVLNFRMVTEGVTKGPPRSEECAEAVDTTFNLGMGKLVSDKRYSPEAHQFMDTLIDNLRKAYVESFENVKWMQSKTKQEALKKAKAIEAMIGIQTKDFDYTDIDKLYTDVNFQVEGDFNTNNIWNDKQSDIKSWKELNQPVDKDIWTSSMTVVNAYYDPNMNEVVFPLGILQYPFFVQGRPSYMNYGGIGMVIGHEIGHGFDSEGRHQDYRGRVRDWWTPQDSALYNKKAQCFIDQHKNFTMDIGGVEHHLNGDLTITEDIADHLGTVHSFRAYSFYSEKNKNDDWPLPGLRLTDKQLFFVSLAQSWCQISTDELLLTLLDVDTHTDGKYRVIGSLQNNKDFADVFGCKVGSYMNPSKKCTLW